MTTLSTDTLRELIDAKHLVLVQLRDMGSRQAQLIEQNDMSELMKLLATKQHVIATLQSVEQRLNPFRDEVPDQRVWRSVEDRAQCARVAAACQQLLDEIVGTEKTNEAQMAARRDDTASRLKVANAANRARAAYAANDRYRPRPHGRQTYESPNPPKRGSTVTGD